MKKADKYNYKN